MKRPGRTGAALGSANFNPDTVDSTARLRDASENRASAAKAGRTIRLFVVHIASEIQPSMRKMPCPWLSRPYFTHRAESRSP